MICVNTMSYQDWETVTIRKNRTPGYNRTGASGATGGAGRPAISHEARVARELDGHEMTAPVVKRLSDESRRKIISTRGEKDWDQKKLNTMCAFPKNTIRDIEAGHVQPSPKQLSVLNNILGVALKYE